MVESNSPKFDPTLETAEVQATWERRVERYGHDVANAQYAMVARRVARMFSIGLGYMDAWDAIVGGAWDSRLGMEAGPIVRHRSIKLVEAFVSQGIVWACNLTVEEMADEGRHS